MLAGVLHGLAFPPAGMWPLAFVSLAPLVVAARGAGPWRGAFLGWLAGTVASSIATTPWIMAATRQYFDQGPVGAALFATLVGQVFHAMPTAIFAASLPRLARLGAPSLRALAAAACWTTLELARSRLFTGAPWDLLAHALYAQPLWIQSAELGGAYLPSFVLATMGAALAEGRRGLVTGAVVVGLAAGFGAWRLAVERDDGPSLPVALVQGDVPNAWRVDVRHADDAFAAFAEATRMALGGNPRLVVWSENAVSFLLAPNPRFAASLATLLGPDGPPLVLGGPRFVTATPGRATFFNSAYLLSPAGYTLGTYDKRRLVPFAEYAPVATVPGLGWRFDAPGDYSPGSVATVFPSPEPFGVLICFEAIYPALARDLVANGARFLLNISNDAWFGNTAGLEQHFAIGVFRAVETRRALARATNTGVTALVGPSGRILRRFPADVRGGWTVPVPLRDGLTPYARFGDAFAWLAVAATVAGLIRAGR